MRRTALITLSIVAVVVLLLSLKPHRGSMAPFALPPHPAPSQQRPRSALEGTFTGDVIHTRYGPVQLAVSVHQGRITAVKALRLPSVNGRDREIAAFAVPRLTHEALKAQSAHIDAVSGASYTSQGYAQSLQSALDRAGA
ncbi:FMN-binding protein [Streptomyces sp. NPDC051569]|uniref:FMN-binding protein n=1 Tax=Streptomyces sp. NPDC051569 TaxID=3365661 RepID=UPI0037A39233